MENEEKDAKEIKEEDMKQKMLLQLHEQYAQNNNANLSSVIGLITAGIAILGFYGYVFVFSSLEFADNLGKLQYNGTYTIDALVFMTMAVFIVVGILQYICMYQGCHQRYEQFITHAIRCKYELFHINQEKEKDRIFPKNYHPFGKGNTANVDNCSRFICAFICPNRNMRDIVQGLFGELVVIFSCILWIVGIATKIKIQCAIYERGTIQCSSIINIVILVIVVLCINSIIALKAISLSNKYQERCKD